MTLQSSMTVGRRVGLGVSLLIAMTVAVAVLGLFSARQNEAMLKDINDGSVKPLALVGEMHYLIARNRILVTDVAMNAVPEVLARRSKEYAVNKARIEALWAQFMAAPMSDAERALAREVDTARRALTEQGLDATLALEQAGKTEDGWYQLKVVSQLNPAYAKAMDRLFALQLQAADEEYQASLAAGRRLNLILGVVVVAAIGLGVGVGLGLIRNLRRALGAEPGDLAAVAQRIAQGSLVDDGQPPAPEGSVMASMQSMRSALVSLVSGVRTGVEHVASASVQIAQGNADLSSRTESQAASLEQTAASMDELTGTVRASAENARLANERAHGASEAALRGGEVVAKVVQTMGEIQSASSRIADITSVIDGIAFQTNILALNAAVEAARAGEQGRGFAVVASEVRSLAQRSADAARQIKQLINDSVEKVNAGGALVQDAGTTMGDVVSQVRQVSDLIGEITVASAEQSRGIDQVGQAVSHLDQTTQQNAALVEQSAAAAESLKQQAERLAHATAAFRLEC
ncbi:MAG: Tar ligand binding domain-containing protein [Rubrivivax sp.]|nr:Tar ligand binding domain-containing protein [Rubrivivax sp.]